MDNQIFNSVCRDLPYGYEIQVCLENGAAYVTLTTEDGHYAELPDTADKTLEEQISDALKTAIELSSPGKMFGVSGYSI
jgi:hypothetical protein